VLGADLATGRLEALEHGFIEDCDGLIAMRHEAIGRAVERDLLPGNRARYHAALAVGVGTRLGGGAALDRATIRALPRRAIEAAGVAASRHAAADELAALELALAIPEDRDYGVVRPWAERPVWDRVGLQVGRRRRPSPSGAPPGRRPSWRSPSAPSILGRSGPPRPAA
jgi:hypothetical protein